MSNFFDMVKKVGGIFYVRWAVTLFIAVCVGFGIVGPILHSFD